MHILIVDDDRLIRMILKRCLSRFGHEVVEAADGEEAWAILQEQPIQFVISDWMMPQLNGIDLCARIRQTDLGRYIYFILLTARNTKQDIIEGIEAGADDFMPKPFDEHELRVRLRSGERVVALERDLAEQNLKIREAYDTIQRDLKAAAEIQKSLLPASQRSFNNYAIDWIFQPCEVVGGDGFNFVQLDENHLAFYIWDVAGHGIPAAMLSVTISKMLTQDLIGNDYAHQDRETLTPSAILAKLNNSFQADDDAMQYFTMIYGIINMDTGKVLLGQAGHPSPLLIKPNNETIAVGEGGLPLGLIPDMTYDEEEYSVYLQPGDRLVLYSDGVTECLNPDREMFTTERLIDHLRVSTEQPLDTTLEALHDSLITWRGSDAFDDDVSLFAIERRAA
ncbi:MAG: SpoIIE family protein phosphatase [Bacteroidota bacterium]